MKISLILSRCEIRRFSHGACNKKWIDVDHSCLKQPWKGRLDAIGGRQIAGNGYVDREGWKGAIQDLVVPISSADDGQASLAVGGELAKPLGARRPAECLRTRVQFPPTAGAQCSRAFTGVQWTPFVLGEPSCNTLHPRALAPMVRMEADRRQAPGAWGFWRISMQGDGGGGA